MNIKPTPGPWRAKRLETYTDPGYVIVYPDASKPGVHMRRLDYRGCLTEQDANLIAEAGTVYHETGLTPRQLAEQRGQLLEALERAHMALTGYLPAHRNAVTDAAIDVARTTLANVRNRRP